MLKKFQVVAILCVACAMPALAQDTGAQKQSQQAIPAMADNTRAQKPAPQPAAPPKDASAPKQTPQPAAPATPTDATAKSAASDTNYVIGAQDVLDVSVWKEPEVSRVV